MEEEPDITVEELTEDELEHLIKLYNNDGFSFDDLNPEVAAKLKAKFEEKNVPEKYLEMKQHIERKRQELNEDFTRQFNVLQENFNNSKKKMQEVEAQAEKSQECKVEEIDDNGIVISNSL